MKRLAQLAILVTAASFWLTGFARAQEGEGLLGVKVNADQLNYDVSNQVVTAEGNVVIGQGSTELRADRVTIHRPSSIAQAEGHVRLVSQNKVWEGERLTYNLATKEIQSDGFSAVFPPYHVWAASGAKGTGITYTLERATFTTCTQSLETLHYHLWARELTVVPDSYLTAKHVVPFAGPIPFFYLPYMKRSLTPDVIGVELQPGYESRMGAYLLSGFSYRFTNWFEATTLIDYRSERGFAGGEELDWKTPGGRGKALGYFINDTGTENDNNDYPTNRIPDSNRYRLRLKQAESFEDGWSFLGEFNKFSDEYVYEDFYKREYRNNPDPMNYAMVGRTTDETAMSVLGKWRTDDFYSTVSRLPEARHEFFLTPVQDSGWYYQGYNDAVYLIRQPADFLEDETGAEEVDVFRVDSGQMLTHPMSLDIFHLVPRAGVRATWFSKTKDTVDWDHEGVVTNVLADGSTLVTNGTVRTTFDREGGAELRPLFEVGSEASFKAFRDWANGGDGNMVKYRHIAEPYADYTLRPDLLDQSPDDFYQFDEVDSYGSVHSFKLGMRNTVQFKRDKKLYELFDLDIHSTYYMESQNEDEGVGPMFMKVESKPSDEIYLRGDAQYNVQDSELEVWNFRGQFTPHPMWRLLGEYRYRNELNSLGSSTVKYIPSAEWQLAGSVRYNIDESRLEEHAYDVEHVMDCMGVRFGFAHEPSYTMLSGEEREDNYSVHLELWLTAFPGSHWGTGPR